MRRDNWKWTAKYRQAVRFMHGDAQLFYCACALSKTSCFVARCVWNIAPASKPRAVKSGGAGVVSLFSLRLVCCYSESRRLCYDPTLNWRRSQAGYEPRYCRVHKPHPPHSPWPHLLPGPVRLQVHYTYTWDAFAHMYIYSNVCMHVYVHLLHCEHRFHTQAYN